MANNNIPNTAIPEIAADFIGELSTDNIWRGVDMNRCLSDDLDTIESGIAALEAGKAAASHTHAGYAAAAHTHAQSEISGLSDALSGKADTGHTHAGYAAAAHGHGQSEISGLADALAGKAAASHTHDYAAFNHAHLGYSGASASTYKLVYVGPDGSDDNDGASQSTPMATVKGAIRKYAESYKFLDIRLLDGTYNEDIGAIGTDVSNLSIRSVSENKDAVTINMTTQLDLNSGTVRLYNMTLNVTETGVRGISVNAGGLYAYNIRVNLPAGTTTSCVNVYNGVHAFLMQCILNAGTGTNAGAAVYGNQALQIKAIGCTSERKINVGVHAHNGSDIIYTDTLNATTKTKETYYGKCTLRA